MSLDLSIIIVQYKTPELLMRCIGSVYDSRGDVSVEVIVVNNDVEDNFREEFIARYPGLIWLDAGYNAGFSRANNIGIKQATGEYILLLNPDTEIKGGFLRTLISGYQKNDTDHRLGLLGCRIISSVDQSLLVGSGVGFPSIARIAKANPLVIYLTRSGDSGVVRKYDPYTMHYRDHEIDFVSGACVMISRAKLLRHDLYLDEDFFLYSEDVEWAHRVKSKGLRNYFDSEIEVYHVNSASTRHSQGKFFQIQISGYLYFLKAYGLWAYLLFGFILWSNFKLNMRLLKSAQQLDEYHREKEQYIVFKRYFFPILKQYYFSSKKDRPYLKYSE